MREVAASAKVYYRPLLRPRKTIRLYTTLRPRKLEVNVETCNFVRWECALKRYARARRLVPALKGEQGNIHIDKYELMSTELEGIIEESVPESAFQRQVVTGLSDSVTELPPKESVAAIKTFCSRLITPAM